MSIATRSRVHRPRETRQRNAAGEPDRHLRLAVAPPERHDDGDEQRQHEDGGQVGDGGVAHQQHHVLRGDIAAGGLAERLDQREREHDGQDDHQRDPETARQLGPRG